MDEHYNVTLNATIQFVRNYTTVIKMKGIKTKFNGEYDMDEQLQKDVEKN